MIATASRIQSHYPISPTHVNELDNVIVSVNPILEENDGRAHASFGIRNEGQATSGSHIDKAGLDIVKGESHTKKVVQEAAFSVTHANPSEKECTGEHEIRDTSNKPTTPQHQYVQQEHSEPRAETETANESIVIAKSAESHFISGANDTIATEDSSPDSETMNYSLTAIENETPTLVVPNAASQEVPQTVATKGVVEDLVTVSSTAATSTPASPCSDNDNNSSNSPTTNSISTDPSISPQIAPRKKLQDEGPAAGKQHQVCFSQITIRRYPMTLGDVSV